MTDYRKPDAYGPPQFAESTDSYAAGYSTAREDAAKVIDGSCVVEGKDYHHLAVLIRALSPNSRTVPWTPPALEKIDAAALSALEKERDELAARLVSNSEYHMREKATLRAENAKLRGGWEEATIAWAVCASLHREYCKGKDPFYKTRQADFLKHETDARAALVQSEGK
jgi:hypothetical protein